MSLSSRIARWTTHHPGLLVALLCVVSAAAFAVVLGRTNFDSEILNLLPADEPSVQGLKLYNSQFTQSRELAFLLSGENAEVLEEVTGEFAAQLAHEQWVERVAAGSPMDSPGGIETLPQFLVPLLLQLPEEETRSVLDSLRTEVLDERAKDLVQGLRAGSPRAVLESTWDPLGVLRHPASHLASRLSIHETFAFVSSTGKERIVSVITNQPDGGAVACAEMMANVRKFLRKFLEEKNVKHAEIKIAVTGRAAFVEEISSSMKRDIFFTSLASGLGICLLFFFVYRSLLPLAGILLLLSLASLAALALGLLFFPSLNLIAVAFCSILFGLGSDFALLLIQKFRDQPAGESVASRIAESIASRFRQIAGVALTTAIGFSALVLSSSEGFAQLGILTSTGILLCAIFLPVWLFLFLPARWKNPDSTTSSASGFFYRMGNLLRERPARILTISLPVLVVATLLAVLPWQPLSFDTRSSSLEPQNAPASIALRKMMSAFPDTFEPTMILVEADTPGREMEQAEALEALLARLKDGGQIVSHSIASPLLRNPQALEKNLPAFQEIDFAALASEWKKSSSEAGLSFDDSSPASLLLPFLGRAAQAGTSLEPMQWWREHLPANSPWWFLIDRAIAPEGGAFLLYATVPESGSADFLDAVASTDPDALVTGWSVMLRSLVPWAEKELRVFLFGVGGAIFLVLALLYRNWRAWVVHLAALVFSISLLLASLKLFDVRVNLLNVLAFPLILGVGVDYATHFLLAALGGKDTTDDSVVSVVSPVVISALTTMIGFGALIFAWNPALSGLGILCVLGVCSCLLTSLVFVLPLCKWVAGGVHRR